MRSPRLGAGGKLSPPPATNTSSPFALSSASSTEWATSTPGADQVGSRVTTIVGRPGRGRPPMESKVRRPMIIGCPIVSALKRRWSAGRRQGRRLSMPMARLAAMAAIRVILIGSSYGDRRLDRGMRIITAESEVLVVEIEQRGSRRIEGHRRQWPGLAGELQAGLVQVVAVEVGIAQGVDEVAGRQSADLGHHQGQQGIGGDVERHAQEDVGAALIKL